MSEDELAALVVALEIVTPAPAAQTEQSQVSRWKLAARMPELGMEDLRALH